MDVKLPATPDIARSLASKLWPVKVEMEPCSQGYYPA